jgi:hypothetical protein
MLEYSPIISSITGGLNTTIDIVSLSLCIPIDKKIYKYVCGKLNYYQFNSKSLISEHNIDLKNIFYNEISFYCNEKASIKFFSNGKLHIVGFINCDYLDFLNYILDNIINKNYYLLEKNNNKYMLNIFYKNPNAKVIKIKNNLINFHLKLKNDIIFSNYLKQHINFPDNSPIKVYLIREQFKGSAISLEFKDQNGKIGYVNIFEKSIVISIINEEYRNYIVEYFSDIKNLQKICIIDIKSTSGRINYLVDILSKIDK